MYLAVFFNACLLSISLYGQSLECGYQIKYMLLSNFAQTPATPQTTPMAEQTASTLSDLDRYLVNMTADERPYGILSISSDGTRYRYQKHMNHPADLFVAKLLRMSLGIENQNFNTPDRRSITRRVTAGYQIDIEESPLDWQPTNLRDTLLGFSCEQFVAPIEYVNRKGKRGTRNIRVWVTTEIPIHFGPEGVSGLPGLCLRYAQDNRFVWEATEIAACDEPMKIPRSKNALTREDYHRRLAERAKRRQIRE